MNNIESTVKRGWGRLTPIPAMSGFELMHLSAIDGYLEDVSESPPFVGSGVAMGRVGVEKGRCGKSDLP